VFFGFFCFFLFSIFNYLKVSWIYEVLIWSFTQGSCIILNNFIIRLRRGLAGKCSLLTPLTTFSPTRMLFFFALVRYLSSVLCKKSLYYKFTEISLICICYRATPGLCRLTSGTRRVTPGLCRRCPGQSRSGSGATPVMNCRKP